MPCVEAASSSAVGAAMRSITELSGVEQVAALGLGAGHEQHALAHAAPAPHEVARRPRMIGEKHDLDPCPMGVGRAARRVCRRCGPESEAWAWKIAR